MWYSGGSAGTVRRIRRARSQTFDGGIGNRGGTERRVCTSSTPRRGEELAGCPKHPGASPQRIDAGDGRQSDPVSVGDIDTRPSGLDAVDVLARAGVDPQHIADFDEQRHLDRGAGRQRGGLGTPWAVSPRMPGSVSLTASSTKLGGTTEIGSSFHSVTLHTSCPKSQLFASVTTVAEAAFCLEAAVGVHEMPEVPVGVEELIWVSSTSAASRDSPLR